MQYRYIVLLASLLAATPLAVQAAPHHRPRANRPAHASPQSGLGYSFEEFSRRMELSSQRQEEFDKAHPGDQYIAERCRFGIRANLQVAGADTNDPAYAQLLSTADQACINYIIRGRLAGLFKHIHEHTNLDGADTAKPGQIKLSLPATEHFPFLKSAAQQGNTVEFTFNDIIPQLSGRKLVATFGIEKGYSDNQLVFSGSDQTTVPHELLLYNILPPSARHTDADTDGDNTTD